VYRKISNVKIQWRLVTLFRLLMFSSLVVNILSLLVDHIKHISI